MIEFELNIEKDIVSAFGLLYNFISLNSYFFVIILTNILIEEYIVSAVSDGASVLVKNVHYANEAFKV